MSLSPESLRPQEIASLCPKLLDGKSVDALVAVVHAAIEEVQASADRLIRDRCQSSSASCRLRMSPVWLS